MKDIGRMMLHFRGSDWIISQGSTWYGGMDILLMALGFTESKANSNLYFKVEDEILMMILLYVDDMFLTGENNLIKYANMRLSTEFEMKYLGMMHYFLGTEVW